MIDYSPLDQSSILRFIFYPRKDFTPCPGNGFDLSVPVGGPGLDLMPFLPGSSGMALDSFLPRQW